MGPSENDLELLSDNRTIMAVIRPDGDSACSSGTYRWYATQFPSSQRAIAIEVASRFRMIIARAYCIMEQVQSSIFNGQR